MITMITGIINGKSTDASQEFDFKQVGLEATRVSNKNGDAFDACVLSIFNLTRPVAGPDSIRFKLVKSRSMPSGPGLMFSEAALSRESALWKKRLNFLNVP